MLKPRFSTDYEDSRANRKFPKLYYMSRLQNTFVIWTDLWKLECHTSGS